jgi:hypothetical protein
MSCCYAFVVRNPLDGINLNQKENTSNGSISLMIDGEADKTKKIIDVFCKKNGIQYELIPIDFGKGPQTCLEAYSRDVHVEFPVVNMEEEQSVTNLVTGKFYVYGGKTYTIEGGSPSHQIEAEIEKHEQRIAFLKRELQRVESGSYTKTQENSNENQNTLN